MKNYKDFLLYTSSLYNKNIELFYDLQNKTLDFNIYNNQIIFDKKTKLPLLLSQEEEKFLIYKINELKTIIFLNICIVGDNFDYFEKKLKFFMSQEEDENEEDENTYKDNFNMTYSDKDKNKKRMSYENRNELILMDFKIITKSIKKLKKQFNENSKNLEKTYEKELKLLIPIINKINPTLQFFKQMIKNEENTVTQELTDNTMRNIERIKDIVDIIVKFNIRLVIKEVKNYKNKVPNNIEFNDLKNEGIIGLMNSIYKFSTESDYKLSTYATWWIRQHIIQFINNNKNPIIIPLYYSKMISEYEKIKLESEKENKELTDEEIAEKMNISYKKLKKAKNLIKNTKIISLNQSNSDNEEFSLEDILSSEISEEEEDIEKKLMNSEIKDIIEKAIESLNPKEKYIIKERLELFNEEPKTLEELGKKFSRTRERIRQLEVEAFKKLKKILKEYDLSDF